MRTDNTLLPFSLMKSIYVCYLFIKYFLFLFFLYVIRAVINLKMYEHLQFVMSYVDLSLHSLLKLDTAYYSTSKKMSETKTLRKGK